MAVSEAYIEDDFTIQEISSLLNVSESTVYLRMCRYNLSKMEFPDISNDGLDEVIAQLTREFPFCRENMLKQLLRGKDIKAHRMRLRGTVFIEWTVKEFSPEKGVGLADKHIM